MGDKEYSVGNVGEAAQVIQGDGNYLLDIKIENAADAEWLAKWVREQEGARAYHGPLLPRLEPLVLGNRARELEVVDRFCEDSEDSLLYVVGLAGMGKSTVARAAIAVRSSGTPAVWVTCEGLDADRLLAELDAGLDLDVHAVLADPTAALSRKISAALGATAGSSIVVLDGFEALLDEQGRFAAPGVEDVVHGFVNLDHRAKVIATSRRLPSGVGKGAPGVEVYDLRGLDDESAEELFRMRAERAASNGSVDAPQEVLAKLDGHPKLIELVASATAELPLEQIVEGVLTATDVGDFVVSQVLDRLDEAERVVLEAGAVFRSAFPFEALEAVVEALQPGLDLEQPVRRLVRRSIFETVGGTQLGYFVHPVLREAAAGSPGTQAQAHAAAAGWFLRGPIDPESLTSWDPGLYHLRRAAEFDPSETFVDPYLEFLREHDQQLTFAGWSRRLVEEYQHLFELAGDTQAGVLAAWSLGITLWQLEDYEQAIEIFTSLSEGVREAYQESPDDAELAEFLALVDLKLGDSFASQGRIARERDGEEAAQPYVAKALEFADQAEEVVRRAGEPHLDCRFAEARFGIARALDDKAGMLEWGERYMAAAEAWRDAEPGPTTEDALAEASFSLGLAELLNGKIEEGFGHLVNQLRIKLEIGKIPGVAAGLLNLGALSQSFFPTEGGAFVLTSWQMSLEMGLPMTGWDEADLVELIEPSLADPEGLERGRAAVGEISERLVPYWERGAARLGASPGASTTPSAPSS